jgi:hypothetical protein
MSSFLRRAGRAVARTIQVDRAGPVVAADWYVCPADGCTHSWYRPDVGVSVPDCSTHRVRLVRES